MRVVDVDGTDPLLERVFAEVLEPSFPPDELGSVDGLRDGIVTALVDDDGTPQAVAVGEWSPEPRVLLLGYLAARPGERSKGLGGRLLTEVVNDRWQQRFEPVLTLAEIENPTVHHGSEAYGDPAKRLRFYARHGARALDLPYFQPALKPGQNRVYGLLLAVLHQPEPTDTVAPGPVRAFLTEYLQGTEGEIKGDAATAALWAALDRPGGIPLLSMDDPEKLPASTPTP